MNTSSIDNLTFVKKKNEKVKKVNKNINIEILSSKNFLTKEVKKANDKSKIKKLVNDKSIKTKIRQEGSYYPDEHKELRYTKENYPKLHAYAKTIPNNIIGVITKFSTKLFKKDYDNTDKEIRLEGISPVKGIETADLTALYDSMPNDSLTQGDKVYIINGKPVSAWGLYYGMNSIKSPENYPRNLDLIWNVPYIFSSFELKAEMGLGANFKVSDGENSQDSEEEKWVNWLLKERLNVNNEFRKKCSFHEDSYGNYYIHIHRDDEGITDKLTILQPERMKVFIDPMTTKVLFYVYLPPIMAGTIIGATNNNQTNRQFGITNSVYSNNPAMRLPLPVIIPVTDMIHVTDHQYTEYPFGFSCVKPILEVTQTRFDCNIMVPYYFKKYIKPTIHWKYSDEDLKGKSKTALTDMENKLEGMEPGSDLISVDRWKGEVIQANQGQSEIYAMLNDCDNQIFACLRVPETYFKAKGTTDKTATNEDKTFLGSLKQKQSKFAEAFFKKVIKPSVNIKFGNGLKIENSVNTIDMEVVTGFSSIPLKEYDSFYKMNYPKMEFEDITKTDITQEIANVTSLLNNDIITHERAAQRLGEKYDEELKKYEEVKRKTEMEQMEMNIEQQEINSVGETDSGKDNSFTELKGGNDMTKQSRTSELANPDGKYKRADNKLSDSKGDKVDRVKEPVNDKKKVETADNFLMINGERISIINGDE